MEDGVHFDSAPAEQAFTLLMQYSAKTQEEEFKTMCKGILGYAYTITPPATGKNKGQKVKAFDEESAVRGIQKIERELRGIFRPGALKGTRTIPLLFGEANPPVKNKPPYIVKTKELWPDVAAIHTARDKNRHGGRMTRGRKQPYFVDVVKYEALREQLTGRVGWLASGFNAAAKALGVRIPAYARKHLAPGQVKLELTDGRLHFYFENAVKYSDAPILGLQRLLNYAVQYQANAMMRQLPRLIAAAAKRSGFQAAA